MNNFKKTSEFFYRLFFFYRKIQGNFLEKKTNKLNKPIKIQDIFGNIFWQYPGDNISFNWERQSITDAFNVIRYIAQNVYPNSICIDIGANLGSVSVALWKQIGRNGRVISIEADPRNIDKLKANLELNNCPSSYVHSVAITNKKTQMKLKCYPRCNGWQTLGTKQAAFAEGYDYYSIDVNTTTFEEIMLTHQFNFCDFVKIDVEGAELLVLQGMRYFLEHKKVKQVLFEVNQQTLETMNCNVNDLMAFWQGLDYSLWVVDIQGDLQPLSEQKWYKNTFCDCVALVNY
jgi:FkbM family methyltransferase